MEKRKCKFCGEEFEGKSNKLFCSHTCNTLFHSRKRYKIMRTDKKYMEQNKLRTKEWVSNHREEFNRSMKPIAKKYQRKIRKERRAKGLCPKCGNDIDDKEYKTCLRCREKIREVWRNKESKDGKIKQIIKKIWNKI